MFISSSQGGHFVAEPLECILTTTGLRSPFGKRGSELIRQWKPGRYTRCRLHGGTSTGPRTEERLERSRRARWTDGRYSEKRKEWRQQFRAFIRWSRTALRAIRCELKALIETTQFEIHAAAIRSRADWIHGFIDPAANGRDQADGHRLIQMYRNLGHLQAMDNPA